MILEIINSSLTYTLHVNPHLVYSLLYQREIFTPFHSRPGFIDLVQNIEMVWIDGWVIMNYSFTHVRWLLILLVVLKKMDIHLILHSLFYKLLKKVLNHGLVTDSGLVNITVLEFNAWGLLILNFLDFFRTQIPLCRRVSTWRVLCSICVDISSKVVSFVLWP